MWQCQPTSDHWNYVYIFFVTYWYLYFMLPRGLLKEFSGTLSIVARAVDAFCVFVGGMLSFVWRFDQWVLPQHYQIALLIGLLLTVILFNSYGMYQSWRGQNWWRQVQVQSLSNALVWQSRSARQGPPSSPLRHAPTRHTKVHRNLPAPVGTQIRHYKLLHSPSHVTGPPATRAFTK